jgi:hypothetical protein
MSTIIKLDKKYDIWLSQSWSNNDHGICGHTFELIDYYYILKNKFKVGIFLTENLDWEILEKTIRYKYNFSDLEIEDIKSNTVFSKKPKILFGKNILFVDGGVVNMSKVTLYFDNIFYFACGNKEVKNNDKKNVWILQDDRVYEAVKQNGINYKKRILFDKLKLIQQSKKQTLLYATKNCRQINNFSEYLKYGKILAIVNKIQEPLDGIQFKIVPIQNLFEQFDTYIYTPIERKWDCSPRLLTECVWYQKKIIFHNIDYWHIDHGLYWRWQDIQNDFDSLCLRVDDEIINILKGII